MTQTCKGLRARGGAGGGGDFWSPPRPRPWFATLHPKGRVWSRAPLPRRWLPCIPDAPEGKTKEGHWKRGLGAAGLRGEWGGVTPSPTPPPLVTPGPQHQPPNMGLCSLTNELRHPRKRLVLFVRQLARCGSAPRPAARA